MEKEIEIMHESEILEHESNSNANHEYDFNEKIITENNITLSIFPSKRKKVKKVNIVIEGQFNITNVRFVKDHCHNMLQYFDLVNITLKNVVDIDLAAIQLLHVLNSSTQLQHKTIIIESELSKDDKALIISAGMLELMSKRK
ncbi:MAG: hypothetical protein V4677_01635 [Bacteroidota bacterium]